MSDLLREEFEAWINGAWQGVYLGRNPENSEMFSGQYRDSEVHARWIGWQASRESLVVDLPKPIESYGSQGHHASDPDEALILEDVHTALTAAGVKYK